MKKSMCLISFLIIGISQATGTVDLLKIDNNVLLFSTTETKSDSVLTCVSDDNTQNWAVSLQTDEGQGIYALLLAAVSNNQSITVESAEDCGALDGTERASSVAITK
jgi:hypothetical protein